MKIGYLVLVFIFFLTGCVQNNIQPEEKDTFNIVTSFYPVYIFTKNIVKDIPDVTLSNMSNDHLGCLHDYTLSTSDMKLIDGADAFIINGAGMESFLEKVYENNENLSVIDSSQNIELISNRFSDKDNEHIWLSITNAILQTKNIGNSLAKLDSLHSELYLKNTEEYVKKLENLRNELRQEMYGNVDVQLVTSDDAFSYLAEDFDFDIVAVIEKEEGEAPTSKEMQEIIEIIKENNIKGILVEGDSSAKIASTIADETKTNIFYLDTITYGNGNINDYENRMRDNINKIKESL